MSDDAEPVDEHVPAAAGQHVAPAMLRDAFHCPHCGVLTSQTWSPLMYSGSGSGWRYSRTAQCTCDNCQEVSYWYGYVHGEGAQPNAAMVWPLGSAVAPVAHPDMPDAVRPDYDEARAIVDRSPRGAAALLRLALQKLCKELGQKGKNIDDDIKAMVANGLPEGVQMALDSLRVIGNNAVHPGELDLKDDRDTALSLFALLNFIVEQQISEPKQLSKIYALLPEGARKAIEKRDGAA